MKEKITAILAEIKNDPSLVERITGSTSITNDIGLDSLQMINFILRIEDEFGIEIDFEAFDFSHLKSLDAFCDFLSKMM